MITALVCAIFAHCAPVQSSASTSEAATMELAIPLVARWEGVKTTAYLDRIAVPPVWTICYGETEGVRAGETRTMSQCEAGLRRGLIRYRNGLHAYFTAQTVASRLTPHRDAAFVSFSWNVGIAGAGRSTATKRLNGGDIRGACTAMTWWNKAGGRVIRGLVNRRQDEYDYCMRGIAS